MQRFISEDRAGFAGGLNLHAYVGNAPTTMGDPLGFGPGDGSYGFSDRDFRDRFHRNWKSPGGPDATKEQLQDAYEEWKRQGKPKRDRKDKHQEKRYRDEPQPEPEPAPEPKPEEPSKMKKVTDWMRDDQTQILVTGVTVAVVGGLLILSGGREEG